MLFLCLLFLYIFMLLLFVFFFFFFKQKTAYEMRISDWSSDVCSSDLFDIAENRIVLQALPVVVAGLIIILPDNLCIDIAGCRIGVVDFIVHAHTAVFVIGTDHPSERRAC